MPKLFPHRIAVETDRPDFPKTCACCNGNADTAYIPTPPPRAPGMPVSEEPLTIPYCNVCLSHLRAYEWLNTWRLISLNIGVWWVALGLVGNVYGVALLIGPLFAILIYGEAFRRLRDSLKRKPTCNTTESAVRFVWYRKNTYVFSFASPEYAGEFTKLNHNNLSEDI